MLKTGLTFGIITLVIIAGGVFLLSRDNQEQNLTNETLPDYHQYFWSQTCPHCDNVNDFIETWEGKGVFEMEKIEINNSNENIMLFLQRGTQVCRIPRNQLGVPLLVTPNGKCLSGDVPIIDYLKSFEL
jgi:glutaredoxin-related protein